MSISSISSTSVSSIWDSLLKANAQNNSTSTVSKKDSSSDKSILRDLIDKVSGDTASDADVQELAAKLKQMAIEQANRSENTALRSGNSSDTELKNLMEKVKNDTATSEDIKSIATKMKERAADMQAHFGGMGPIPPSGGFNSELKDLIDKVASGSATDSEIKELTTTLQEVVANMQSLTSTTTSTDQTSSDSDMESLLEKIKNGTATDADIQAIATQIKEHRPPKPPGGKPPEGVPPMDDASSTTSTKYSVTDELLRLLSKLSTGTSADATNTTSSSSDSVNNNYAIAASQQLMESFMEAYSQNYNGVVTTESKVIG